MISHLLLTKKFSLKFRQSASSICSSHFFHDNLFSIDNSLQVNLLCPTLHQSQRLKVNDL